MGLSKKRKQHLALITARAAEIKKARKIEVESQQKKRFLRKQRGEEEFLDEYESFQSVSSSDESKFEESGVDRESIDEEDLEVNEEHLGIDGRGGNIQEGLGDNNGGVRQLEDRNLVFRPV